MKNVRRAHTGKSCVGGSGSKQSGLYQSSAGGVRRVARPAGREFAGLVSHHDVWRGACPTLSRCTL
jgi:hypothetical protein